MLYLLCSSFQYITDLSNCQFCENLEQVDLCDSTNCSVVCETVGIDLCPCYECLPFSFINEMGDVDICRCKICVGVQREQELCTCESCLNKCTCDEC